MNSFTNLEQLRQIQDDLREADVDQDVADRAFLDLFELYNAALRGFASRQGVPVDQIDDVVQEVWVVVRTRLPDFQHNGRKGAFRKWLFQLVRGKVIDEVRRRQRHSPGQHQSTGFWDKRVDSETDDGEAEFAQELVRQALQKFYESAPPREREVFELYYSRFQESAPPNEAEDAAFHAVSAERFQLTLEASRAALKRAKVRVREIIDRLLGNS